MLRFLVLATVALVTVASARAVAQPGVLGTFQIVDAKVDEGKLTWSETKLVPVAKEVAVEVVKDGVKAIEKRIVIVTQTIQETRTADLKTLKVTDAAGKAIAADKLAELLKEPTPVVMVPGLLAEKYRALFKEKTVFVEMPAAMVKLPEALPPPKR